MITVAAFRRDLTEFASNANYPASDVQFYLNMANLLINQQRWGGPSTGTTAADYTEQDYGVELFVAHHLALDKRSNDEAAAGAPPGTITGAVSAQSVDKASVSYDTNGTLDENAGHWNLTVYGKRFIRMSRMFGMGPVQSGARPFCNDPLSSQNAYAGPWYANCPNPSDS